MKRGSSEVFKYYMAKPKKIETLTILSKLLDLGLSLQASNHSFLLLDTFVEQLPKKWLTSWISVSPRELSLDLEVT